MNKSSLIKILFLTKSLPIFGGVERWLADLFTGLSNKGYDCVVGLAKGQHFHDPKRFHSAYPELKIFELDGTTGSASGRRLAVEKVLKTIQPDIVIPIMLADGLAEAVRQKQKLRYRIVYVVHEICEGVSNDLSRYGQWLDRIVFVDHSGEWRFSPVCESGRSRQTLIPCGVPQRQVITHNDSRVAQLQIGWCGRLEIEAKRVTDLLDLCDQLDLMSIDYQLNIIGDGSARNHLITGLTRQIENKRVVIQPPMNRDELYRSFYPNIDALLITSDWETGPLVAFEAMMCGCVVVSSDFVGRKENDQLRVGYNCLTFPVGNMFIAVQRIKSIIDQPEEKDRLIKNAKEFANQYRSLDMMIDRWKQLLSEMMGDDQIAIGDPVIETKQGESRLSRLRIPDVVAERIKRIAGRRFIHASVGEEWPFYSC